MLYNKAGELRVWWIPQIPMNAFRVPVRSLREASLLLDVLAKYDIFQFENNVKPDYCNAGGLEVYDPDYADGDISDESGWEEWHDLEGRTLEEIPVDDLEKSQWEGSGQWLEQP